MKIPIGLRFQPRSQDSFLPVPTNSRRVGERTLGFVPVFHFPVPRFSNIHKTSYLDNRSFQEAGEWEWATVSYIQYLFPPLLRTYLVKENYDKNVSIRHFTNGARFLKRLVGFSSPKANL